MNLIRSHLIYFEIKCLFYPPLVAKFMYRYRTRCTKWMLSYTTTPHIFTTHFGREMW